MADLHSDMPKGRREFCITDGQAETVIVFLDRAEVTRSFLTNVVKGENEIIMKNLSKYVDTNSIR